ncbi:hypothetical protein MTR_4g133577 [Medicago truncatula]|uniref:Uncharacterized protein n=1 Tax=Medicago truncatula TaxID=3880 RepID=A0A072UUB2_MEDTR|nr:hypothetical protein MTR_4g133577 [Medicago truncatula]
MCVSEGKQRLIESFFLLGLYSFYRWCGVVISKAFKTKVTFPKTKDFQNFSLCKAENTVWFFQFVHCREEMKVISMPVTQLAAWPRTTHTAIHG